MSFSVGSNVYFKHPKHSWILGTVTAADKTITCKTNDAKRHDATPGTTDKLRPEEDVQPVQVDVMDETPNDLLNLTILHDCTLLRCLFLRYNNDIIYTNIGAIVVALNPFNYKIPHYMDDKMKDYLAEGHSIKQNIPHSWAQAHNTYYEMIDDKRDQCILISGESGAGKTEATKIVMKYLANVSCLSAGPSEKTAGMAVGTKLSSCSPILEAFGNAKTVRNDNSSRFGKFVKVKFSPQGLLIGAHTTKYLLEKSRIITAAQKERVYHSFYVTVRGRLKSLLGLEGETGYKSINAGGCMNNNEFNSAADFDMVCQGMSGVGMSENEIGSVWKVPAAVLSLQNINFLPDGDGYCTIDESTAKYVSHVTKLWAIDEVALRKEFISTTLVLPGNNFTTKPNTVVTAIDTRDALSKAAYDGVFGWLVDKCNSLCDVEASGNWIGLLDIFGFEDFEKNSFEQICINLTNETLQNHYNTFIFEKDMEECQAEGIDIAAIKCPDNKPCLQLISGDGGIMDYLDEECSLGKGTDLTFLEKATAAHSKNEFFERKKMSKDHFIIHHYAASVNYDVNGWLEKNRDTLKDAIKTLVRKSPDAIVSIVLPEPIPQDQKRGKGLTVGGFFSTQVKALLDVINTTNPHWIRCVKPHPAKQAKMFDGVQTMNQLESSGVLGTVKIRKAGYPVRIQHEKFVRRYLCINKSASGSQPDMCRGILSHLDLARIEKSQIGLTKVFMKSEAYRALEAEREKAVVEVVVEIQRICSGYLGRKKVFRAYIEKNRARLMAIRKEKEEKERAEREAKEAARRAAEEKERAAREAEERRRREEERKLIEKRNKAATTLQRHTRGGLCRLRVLRSVTEQQRALFESNRERQMMDERVTVHELDRVRLKSERQWVAWLNEVDQLERYHESEKQREEMKRSQKDRILKRELCRQEDNARRELILEETTARQTIQTKCEVIARHKAQIAAANNKLRADGGTHRRESPKSLRNQGKVGDRRTAWTPGQSAAADRRTEKVLGQYALNRARAFEEFFPEQPPPPQNTFHARAHAWEESRRGASPAKQKSLFERSKNRWERQEEWLDSREAALTGEYQYGGGSHEQESLDNMFSGPFRTEEASLRHLSERQRPTTADTLQNYSDVPSSYTAPRFASPGGQTQNQTAHSPTTDQQNTPAWYRNASSGAAPPPRQSLTPSQRRNEAQLRNTVDWASVFNERLW